MKCLRAGLRPAGFTIVELVVVMVVLGILSMGMVRFISDSADGFADTAGRDQLASSARFALAALTAELRDALPGSIRSSGDCIEFVPVLGGSEYLSLPTAAAALSFPAVPTVVPVTAAAGVAVAPLADVYTPGSPGAVSPPVTVTGPDAGNELTITFSSAHQFPSESPGNRFYLISQPVSYCFTGSQLWRYADYGFIAAQPAPAGLPAALPRRVLVAEDVVAAASSFTAAPAGLQRNGMVDVTLSLTARGTAATFHAAVQVANAR